MAYPLGVVTRSIVVGDSLTVESGTDLTVRATLRSSRGLVWVATGERAVSALEVRESAAAGDAVTFTPPVTDQAGWRDLATGALIDVSAPGSHTHTYTIELVTLRAGRPVDSRIIGPFPLPTGDGSPVDADLLIVAGTVPGLLVSVPDSWSTTPLDVAAAVEAYLLANPPIGTGGDVASVDGKTGVVDLSGDYAPLASGLAAVSYGDSITSLGGYQPHVQSRLGLASYLNRGVSGMPMTDGSVNGPGTVTTILANSDHDTFDLVTIAAGTNDFKLNMPIGSIGTWATSPVRTEFYGAYRAALDHILADNPSARVILCTPIKRNTPSYGDESTNSAGHKLIDYVNAIRAIGEMYALPVCDSYAMSGINLRTLALFTYDNLHPSAAGFERLGRFMGDFIGSILGLAGPAATTTTTTAATTTTTTAAATTTTTTEAGATTTTTTAAATTTTTTAAATTTTTTAGATTTTTTAPAGFSITDSFTRADNAVTLGTTETGGKTWTASNTWGVLSGQAYAVAGTSIATVDVGVTSGYTAKVRLVSANTTLLVRAVSPTQYFYVQNNALGQSGGTGGFVETFATGALGDEYSVTVTEDATNIHFTVAVNGAVRLSDYTVAKEGRPAGTLVGMRGPAGGKLDDFSVVSL